MIERRVENLLELDYPADKLEIVVASDASADRTDELVEAIAAREPRVRLLRAPRGGKVAAQNLAVRETTGEILAFSDANATWAPDALRKLVRSFADPDVALRLRPRHLRGRRRDEPRGRLLALRALAARAGVAARLDHRRQRRRSTPFGARTTSTSTRASATTSRFPYLMVQRGRRAVYDPEAVAFEKPSRDLEDEYRRKVRMFEHCWLITLARRDAARRRLGLPGRARSRTACSATGAACCTWPCSARTSRSPAAAGSTTSPSRKQAAFLALAAAGRPACRLPGAALAYYYVLVTWATVVALAGYLREGVPAVWEKAEGTR